MFWLFVNGPEWLCDKGPTKFILGGVGLGETFIFVKVIKEQKTFATVHIRMFKQWKH